LHVCIFNRSYWPDFGATGQLLTELAEDLVAHHGWDVTVITGYPVRSERRLPRTETRNGVRIVRARGTTRDPGRFWGRASNYVTYFLSACVAGLRVRRADVVVAMTDPPIIGLAGLLMARRAGSRFVFLCQDVFPEVGRLLEDFRNGAVDGVLDRINRFLLRRADAVIALGDTMRQRLVQEKGAAPGKVTVIHNWADCAALAPAPKDNAFTRGHGLTGRFVVMHAGNIGLSQNLDVVLDAAERLREHDDIRFVFVGDGARRQALERQALERGLGNVVFVPFQPRAEMRSSYAAADVFLISLRDGLAGYIVPSKLYGVLAAGKPYVAAVESQSEVADIARRHDCGLVVPPGDAAALATAVLELFRDRDRAGQLGARAREAGLLFDRPRQISAYAALLRDVATSHAA
jgi:colanic acid biosynthesis glycosyl transferase WcaI